MDYKIVKKGNKYYEQEEKQIDVADLKKRLNFWKDKKERIIKEVSDECDPKIQELETILSNLPN